MTRGIEISDYIISNSGGMAENWSILPDLPIGLIFDNGRIYGTPLINSSAELFTITAISEGGNSQWMFDLEVLEPVPQFSFANSHHILYKDSPFEGIKPQALVGHCVFQYYSYIAVRDVL